VTTACPALLIPAERAGVVAPSPWMTKPTVGWVACAPCGTDWPLVNHRSPAVTVLSPLDVVPTFVSEPEPRSPCSVMPTSWGAESVLVTMFSQRTKSELSGTKTLRVTCRFTGAGSVCVWKTSSRFASFCVQSWDARPSPGLKTRGDGKAMPWAPVIRSPLKPANALVSGMLTWCWTV
jgi:hypothetical protein